ncbi:DUF3784 domain-containing protein [Solibacillus sp. MA9]|uniref:DUF3784 domain-containing protein n=1 Tax=Solibacillus palustris TaxID=2908203 RepID=A0ABS9UBE2_9BACL|nr:DUF3784 domain-containing protein [Solibacillus sp. MA9]MCH7321538.1 DUF3784 domain-containing protein [Solibacillus sp. MA9]
MTMDLIIMGALLLVMGFLVGVKKMTWLLAGYNQKRVKDQEKLARLVGGTFGFVGIALVICGVIGLTQVETLLPIALGILLLQVVYVNIKLVE